MPSPGRITTWHPPGGPGVRVDSHAYTNYFVPPNYDSMIGKIIVHGDTREQALARMRTALSETVVEGIQTNIPLHRELMVDAKFIDGGTNIHYLEELAGAAQALSADRAPMFELTLLCAAKTRSKRCRDALDELGCAVASRSRTPTRRPTPSRPLFGEPGMPPPKDGWQRSRVVALFADEAPAQRSGARCCRRRTSSPAASCWASRAVAEQDWVRLTQSQFAPVEITPEFWIVPTWHEPPAAGARR